MNNTLQNLAARVAAIEFVLTQTLIVVGKQSENLDAERFTSVLRASFDMKSAHNLNDADGAVALETVDRILDLVETTLKAPPSAQA